MLVHQHGIFSPDALCCVKALWNNSLLQKTGLSSYSRKRQQPALLDCKDTYFTLCGHIPDWGAISSPWHEVTGSCMEKKVVMLLARCSEVQPVQQLS